ncbi:hypothetical protein [Streptomyces sp. NPDC013455]|uniref:hypothetical protein n=1 Tax=Streptomyces sp. NPDC013455 TaxID=3155605 RepID=UPI0033F5D510
MRLLRKRAGSPSYQQLAAHTHFAPSTLAACASGKRLPSAAVLRAYVLACGGDAVAWEARRVRTRILLDTGQADDASGAPAAQPPSPPASAPDGDDFAAAGGHDFAGPGGAVPAGTAPSAEPGAAPSAATGPTAAQPAATDTTTADTAAAGIRLVAPPGPRPAARRARGPWVPRPAALWWRIAVLGLLLFGCVASQLRAAPDTSAALSADTSKWLNPRAAIPDRYRPAIVRAGTMCPIPQITPALVAAILAAESGFDPDLADPAAQEYGIARWTPRVLRYYLPEDRQDRVPVPPFDPEESILALGRMLCTLTPQLEGVAGDPVMNLAAAWRTATYVVQKENGVPERLRPYTDRVRGHLLDFAPAHGACLPYDVVDSSYPAPCAGVRQRR